MKDDTKLEYCLLLLQKNIKRDRDKREFERVIRIVKDPKVISHEELLTNWRYVTWRKCKGDFTDVSTYVRLLCGNHLRIL